MAMTFPIQNYDALSSKHFLVKAFFSSKTYVLRKKLILDSFNDLNKRIPVPKYKIKIFDQS